MRTPNIKKIIMVSTIILGLFLASFSSISLNAMVPNREKSTQIIPNGDIVFLNNTPPVIDGDLESYEGEWENATVQTTTIGSVSITIRVQANSSHLFMGISYTSNVYININTTIPVGETYNNETHTWLAVVFDKNFDQRIGYSNETADDGVVINYRQLGSQDIYFNGTTVYSMVADDNVTGVENSIGALGEYIDDFNKHVVTIEMAKELNSKDEIGHDIELYEGEPLKYLIILFQNNTAIYNHSLLTNRLSPWKSFRLEPTYRYFSYEEDLTKKSVLTYVSDSERTEAAYDNLTTIDILLDSYGFNNTLKYDTSTFTFTYNNIKSYDLIILVGDLKDLSESEIDAIRFYAASGGSLYILGKVLKDDNPINKLIANFGLQIYNSTVFSEDLGINSTINLDSADIIDIPYFKESTILTRQNVSSIFYQGSALNFTNNGTFGEMYIQFQEADLYATLNKTGEFYVDLDKDSNLNSSKDLLLNDSVVLQAGLELQRGGKVIVTATEEIFNSTNILKADNKYLLIRQIQWLFNFQNFLFYDNYIIEETKIDVGGTIQVQITVFGDNNTIIENLHVWVIILELKADRNQEDLVNTGDNMNFNGSIIPADTIKTNYIDVTIRMHKRGYSYNETQLVEIFMQPEVGEPIKLDIISMILFVVSIGLAIIGSFAIRKYRIKGE